MSETLEESYQYIGHKKQNKTNKYLEGDREKGRRKEKQITRNKRLRDWKIQNITKMGINDENKNKRIRTRESKITKITRPPLRKIGTL